jgi:hypothetical protein
LPADGNSALLPFIASIRRRHRYRHTIMLCFDDPTVSVFETSKDSWTSGTTCSSEGKLGEQGSVSRMTGCK